MGRLVALIDCNNFFVSCERLFRPDLSKKPVIVLSSNDGCVVARSQEIKDKGIPMGIPVFQIKDILKDIDAVTFSSHFALYRDISRRVFEALKTEAPRVEQYSIDEAFFTIEAKSEEDYLKTICKLKDKIETEVGVPVSIGVAETKTLAKLASHWAKRTNGTFVLMPEKRAVQVTAVPLRELWGVGKQSAEAYRQQGILTIGDLLKHDRFIVKKLFGVAGVRLWQEIQGMPAIGLQKKDSIQHSILHSRSFKHTTSEILALKEAVSYHLREAGEDLRQQHLKAGVLQVTLGTSRHSDFFLRGGSKEQVFSVPTDDIFTLIKAAMGLVESMYEPGVPYKKAGVLLYNLVPASIEQATLFTTPYEEKTKKLTPLIDTLNSRLGKKSKVILGSFLKRETWHSSQGQKSPAYTTSWKDIAVVKA